MNKIFANRKTKFLFLFIFVFVSPESFHLIAKTTHNNHKFKVLQKTIQYFIDDDDILPGYTSKTSPGPSVATSEIA